MSKIVVFVFSGLVFQVLAASVNPQQLQHQLQQQQNLQIQGLLRQIQQISSQAQGILQNAQLQGLQDQLLLRYQAIEYAQGLQSGIYLLQQLIQQNQGGQSQLQLQQVARRLGEVIYSVQVAINAQPSILQRQLNANLQNAAAEAQILAQISQQLLQQQQQLNLQQLQLQTNLQGQLREVLVNILLPIQRLLVQGQIQSNSQEELRNQIQLGVSQISSAVQGISGDDQQIAQLLVIQVQQLSRQLGRLGGILRRQAQGQEGDNWIIVQQIANKLIEIQPSLEQIVVSQGSQDAQAFVGQLKNQIRSGVSNAAAQIERLAQLIQQSNQSQGQDGQIQYLNVLARGVIADSIALARLLQLQLQSIGQNVQF